MPKTEENFEVDVSKLDLQAGRRAFLKSSGLLAAGAATLGLGAGTKQAEAQEIDDPTILNFALNLEYLEAEFYLRAAFGRGLATTDTTGTGTQGSVSVPGGPAISTYPKNLSSTILKYAKEIAGDEEAHVKFLRKALGSAAVARPAINFRTAFTEAARAAGLIKSPQVFNAFASDTAFLLAAFIFEDVGVTAYKGAARFIQNPDVLEAAAGILAVEAYHAGAVRTLLTAKGLINEGSMISKARDSLDGSSDLDQGLGTPDSYNIVPTDGNGLAFSRTPQQVLNIVYLGASSREDSFFPKGLNGAVK